nr:flagellar hook capping FlgD N-terminal domain-containing protein [Paenibacillus hamazuiensis]
MSDAISTKNVWPYYSKTNVANAGTSTEKDKNSLGQDAFLKILITQLKNQDPSQPLQDKEFIAQMAQFTSVEQLTNMSNEMKLLRQSLGFASSLIGKEIAWTLKDSNGQTVTKSGVVESISVKDGVQSAEVKGEKIPLEQITKIANAGEGQ